MRGLENEQILGIIVLIAFLLIVIIIVIGPALGFNKANNSKLAFEEFCIQWSLNGYSEDWTTNVKRNSVDYGTPEVNCPVALDSVDICRKCCKKEIAC